MYKPTVEQFLMFSVIICFCMMISCIYFVEKQENKSIKSKALDFFRKRTTKPGYSKVWKLIFWSTKYAQSILLLYLFANGFEDLNNVKNLGYMIFFVLFTAYERLYRKTSLSLVLFVGFFIFFQYYYSLFWQIKFQGLEDRYYMKSLRWWNVIPSGTPLDDPFEQNTRERSWFEQ